MRRGFTLVELIVVIVILAILAAIAIPALTGYIAKAQDKEYIAEARNVAVAVKTVLIDAVGTGEISPSSDQYGLFEGSGYYSNSKASSFYIDELSDCIAVPYGFNVYFKRASALIGEAYPATYALAQNERYWEYWSVALPGPGTTAATADGFTFILYPEGITAGKPVTIVTYKLERYEMTTFASDFYWNDTFFENCVYNPNAGYEVYHTTMTT